MNDQSAPKLALPTQFALHLMASLVGTLRLEEYLGEPSPKLPLYWRTSVVLANDNTASFADISMTIGDANTNDLVATKEKQPLSLNIAVGVLRRGGNGEYRYSQGILKEDTLRSYLESAGIDVETTDPPVMAQSMAQALRCISSFEATNSPRLLLSDPSLENSFCISLYHEDVEESGYLRIKMESDCALSSAAATMLLSNLRQSAPSVADEEEYDASALEQMFVERLVAMQQATRGSKQPASPAATAAITRLSPKKQSSSRPIRPPRGGGVRAGSNRRKKAKTLSYGATKK